MAKFNTREHFFPSGSDGFDHYVGLFSGELHVVGGPEPAHLRTLLWRLAATVVDAGFSVAAVAEQANWPATARWGPQPIKELARRARDWSDHLASDGILVVSNLESVIPGRGREKKLNALRLFAEQRRVAVVCGVVSKKHSGFKGLDHAKSVAWLGPPILADVPASVVSGRGQDARWMESGLTTGSLLLPGTG